MTQGYPQQPNTGYYQQPQQGYAPPVQPPAPQQYPPQQAPAVPQYQQGMGAAPGGFFNQHDQYGVPHPQGVAPAQPTAPEPTTNFFGSGAPFCSWDNAKGYQNGSWYGGLVISKEVRPQTDMDTGQVRTSKFNPNQPLMEMIVELQTSMRTDPQDDGRRRIAIKSDLVRATRTAYQSVGANDIEIGSWYYAAKMRQDQVPNSNGRGTVRRNVFDAKYAPPGAPDPAPQPLAQHIQSAPAPAQQGYAQPMPQAQQYAPPANAMVPQQFAAPAAQQAPAVPQDQAAQFAAWQAQQSVQPQQPGTQQGFPAPEQQVPSTPQGGAAPGAYNPFGPTG